RAVQSQEILTETDTPAVAIQLCRILQAMCRALQKIFKNDSARPTGGDRWVRTMTGSWLDHAARLIPVDFKSPA
ncbi:MAG: hypothetical protein KDB01_03965, partial [Planctomycetaceae bacterium]|nr:hypothetical protein [Planctomycetaceae bacterium]